MSALFQSLRRSLIPTAPPSEVDPLEAALDRLPPPPPVMREARPLADLSYPAELDHLVAEIAAPRWRESPPPAAPADATETVRPNRKS